MAIKDQQKRRQNKSNKVTAAFESILYSLRPALLLEQILGIFRFRVKSKQLLPCNLSMKCIGVGIVALYNAVYFYVGFKVPTASGTIDTIEEYLNLLSPTLLLFHYIGIAIIYSFFKSDTNIQIITCFAELDSRLHVEKSYYKRLRVFVISLIIIISASLWLYSICFYFAGTLTMISISVSNLTYFIQYLEILLFFVFVDLLHKRLVIINDCLEKLVNANKSQAKCCVYNVEQNILKTEKIYEHIPVLTLRELSLAFDIIGRISSLINNVFNFHLFVVVTAGFCYIMITLWVFLSLSRVRVDAIELALSIIWCIVVLFCISCLAFVCERLLSARITTKGLVNELIMNYELPAATRAQAKAFMALIDAWSLEIYVYDLFSVDIQLMLKFFSVFTTYFIVIVQISHFV